MPQKKRVKSENYRKCLQNKKNILGSQKKILKRNSQCIY